MSAEHAHIAIDVQIEGEQIRGQAGDGVASAESFSGWLGLIAVLDRLLERPKPDGLPGVWVAFATVEQAEAFATSALLTAALDGSGACAPPTVAPLTAEHGSPPRADQSPKNPVRTSRGVDDAST